MLPKELAELFDANDPNDLFCRVENLKYENDAICAHFSVRPYSEEPRMQRWRVQTIGLLKFRIEDHYASELSEHEEHPYLWPYNELGAELYIKRRSKDPRALFIQLSEIHRKTLGGSCPIETHFNVGTDLLQLCASEYGLFAKGPLPLLRSYAAALIETGCEPYFFGENEPRRWDGFQWRSIKACNRLLLFGNSWVVAQSFTWDSLTEIK